MAPDPQNPLMDVGEFDRLINQPADFVIKTPIGFKHFLIKTKKESNTYKPTRAMQICLQFASKIIIGSCDIILPDGKKIHFPAKEKGPHGILIIHNDRMARKFLTGGRLGFCESYLDGDWSSPDIAAFFEMILLNGEAVWRSLHGKNWYRFLSFIVHSFKRNTKKGSKKNIYEHYDIGNAFYKEWLDPGMTYSSALWVTGEESLEEAQREKYKNLATMLDIQPHHSVLEIGCGWGGFADYVAGEIGAKVTCITISEQQYAYAKDRIKNKGLEDKVKILMQDYRDAKGSYDRIASIEMFEAVGEQYWPAYFKTLQARLKKGGKAGLQIITIDDEHFESYRRSADYIQRYIFPGGMLPCIHVLREQASKADLDWGHYTAFGKDYARTLSLWNKAFQKAWPNVSDQFDNRFKRLWEQYLCYCQAGFTVGTIDVIQLVLNKPK